MAEVIIDVGVRLQVMQNTLNDLKKQLGNIEIGTPKHNQLSKIIQQLERDWEKLQIQTSKGFSSQQQFNQTSKTLDKMEESIARVKLAMDGVKFSDLKLNPSQLKEFEQIEQELNKAQMAFDDFQQKIKQGIMSKAGDGALKLLGDPKNLEKPYEELERYIETVVSKSINELDKLERAKNKAFTPDVQNFQNSQQLRQGINVDNYKNLGLEQFFRAGANRNGNYLGIKGGAGAGKELLQALADKLGLSDEASETFINDLLNKRVADINKAIQNLKDTDFKKELTSSKMKNAVEKYTGKENEYNTLKTQLQELIQVRDQFNAQKLDGSEMTKAQETLNVVIDQTSQKLAQMRVEKVNAFKTDGSNSVNKMTSELQQFTDQLNKTNTAWLNLQRQQANFNSMKMAVVNFMGFNQVLNLTKRAVQDAMNHIKQLDATMNGISIVTNMTTADLWNQVDAYSDLAQKFGTSIQGAYDISKIYYQQGLETSDVMILTEETLKLSKVSGLDYAKTTDYMTTALRGFKMEMQEASTVVDVYSNLAANTAVSQEELAVAMSKTASSMESVGSTFEETSAMIATMVAVTRESATNIGSAMKSIASRYGELTKDPQKLLDAEGEAMSFNKVDAALKSVGISMQTTDHQFRDFTDVILELSEKWDTLDSTQQRYIATQFAGNRQQSRFLALVSNGDLLQENIENAENSEDVGTLQALKAMDSIESKMNQVQVAAQQFYTTLGAEGVWKGALDGIKNYINGLNSLPKLFGKLPLGAIQVIVDSINIIKGILLNGLYTIASLIKKTFNDTATNVDQSQYETLGENIIGSVKNGVEKRKDEFQQYFKGVLSPDLKEKKQQLISTGQLQVQKSNDLNKSIDSAASSFGTVNFSSQVSDVILQAQQLGIISETTKIDLENMVPAAALKNLSYLSEEFKNTGYAAIEAGQKITAGSSGLKNWAANSSTMASTLGTLRSGFSMLASAIPGAAKPLSALASVAGIAQVAVLSLQAALQTGQWTNVFTAGFAVILTVINTIDTFIEDAEERQERLNKAAEESKNIALEKKNDYKTLDNSIKKLEELEKKRYDSAEAAEEYQTAVDELADKYPQLIASIDEAGNATIESANLEYALQKARQESAQATLDSINKEREKIKNEQNDLAKTPKIQTIDQEGNYRTNANKVLSEDYNFPQNTSIGEAKADIIQELSKFESKSRDSGFELVKSEYGFSGYKITSIEDFEKFLSDNIVGNSEKEELSLDDFIKLAEISEESQEAIDIFNDKYSEGIEDEARYLEDVNNLLDTLSQDAAAMAQYGNTIEQLKNYKNSQDKIADFNDLLDSLKRQEISTVVSTSSFGDFYSDLGSLQSVLISGLNAAYSSIEGYITGTKQYFDEFKNINQSKITEMFKNKNQYTVQDFVDILGEDSEWGKAVAQYYQDFGLTSEEIASRTTNKIDSLDVDTDNKILKDSLDDLNTQVKNVQEKFTVDFGNWVNSTIDIISDYTSKGYTSSASELTKGLTSLLEAVNKLSRDELITARNILSASDLQTVSGVRNARDQLSEAGITNLDGSLETIENALMYNIPLAIEAYTDKLITDLDDLENKIKKAGNGLSVTDALKMLDEVNSSLAEGAKRFTLGDFDFKKGKFVANAELRKAYIESLEESLDLTELEMIQARIDSFKNEQGTYPEINKENFFDDEKLKTTQGNEAMLNSLEELGLITLERVNDEITGMSDIDTDRLNELAEEYGVVIEENESAWASVIKILEKRLENLQIIKDSAITYMEASTYLEAGAYLNYLQAFLGDKEIDSGALQKAARGEAIEGLTYEQIKPLTEKINSEVNNFINDILEKGIENVHLEDYNLEGIIDTKDIEDLQTGNISLSNFILKYNDYLGKTIEEQNALYIQALENETQNTIGASEALSNVKFLSSNLAYASFDVLKKLADNLQVEVNSLFDPTSYNAALGGYKVNMNALIVNGLNDITNASNIIADSVTDFLSSIAEGISKGLEGKLDFAGRDNLISNLQQYGIELDATDFTRTADGLELSNKKAIELYLSLKQIDAISAQITFDNLAKSLEKTNENYSDVSTIARRIAEIEKELASPEISSARREEYERELKVAKEIYQVRSATDDKSFNFMDRSLVNGMQNPIDYWNAGGKGYAAINEAASSGYMEIQDFYNIVTEMNNMALVSGQTLTFMGQTLDGSAESAAAVIEKGFSALTNIDGKGVKIALGNIGSGFELGADAMAGDFDKGLKAMAKSQIKMLDAAINMLEAIVALEELDVEGDGIDFEDIFSDEEGTEFTTGAEKWLKQIEQTVGEIEIGGLSLTEALKTLNPEQVVQFFKELTEIDWGDGANAVQQVQNLISTFFPGKEINIGESIFSLLEIPENAERDSEAFKKWLTDMELTEQQAELLIKKLTNNKKIHTTSSLGQAIEKSLGLDDNEQKKNAFESFVNSNDNSIQASEIKLWEKIDISQTEEGKITGAVYNGSDGGSITLEPNKPENWQEQIIQYEQAISTAKQQGGGPVQKVEEGGVTTYEFTSTVGIATITTVLDENGNISEFIMPDGTRIPAKNQQEAIEKYLAKKESEENKKETPVQRTAKEIAIDEGLLLKTSTEVNFDQEQKDLQDKLNAALNMEDLMSNVTIDEFGNGTIEIPGLGALNFTTDGGEIDEATLRAKIMEALGLTPSTVNDIAAGIGQALKDTGLGEVLATEFANALTEAITTVNTDTEGKEVDFTAEVAGELSVEEEIKPGFVKVSNDKMSISSHDQSLSEVTARFIQMYMDLYGSSEDEEKTFEGTNFSITTENGLQIGCKISDEGTLTFNYDNATGIDQATFEANVAKNISNSVTDLTVPGKNLTAIAENDLVQLIEITTNEDGTYNMKGFGAEDTNIADPMKWLNDKAKEHFGTPITSGTLEGQSFPLIEYTTLVDGVEKKVVVKKVKDGYIVTYNDNSVFATNPQEAITTLVKLDTEKEFKNKNNSENSMPGWSEVVQIEGMTFGIHVQSNENGTFTLTYPDGKTSNGITDPNAAIEAWTRLYLKTLVSSKSENSVGSVESGTYEFIEINGVRYGFKIKENEDGTYILTYPGGVEENVKDPATAIKAWEKTQLSKIITSLSTISSTGGETVDNPSSITITVNGTQYTVKLGEDNSYIVNGTSYASLDEAVSNILSSSISSSDENTTVGGGTADIIASLDIDTSLAEGTYTKLQSYFTDNPLTTQLVIKNPSSSGGTGPVDSENPTIERTVPAQSNLANYEDIDEYLTEVQSVINAGEALTDADLFNLTGIASGNFDAAGDLTSKATELLGLVANSTSNQDLFSQLFGDMDAGTLNSMVDPLTNLATQFTALAAACEKLTTLSWSNIPEWVSNGTTTVSTVNTPTSTPGTTGSTGQQGETTTTNVTITTKNAELNANNVEGTTGEETGGSSEGSTPNKNDSGANTDNSNSAFAATIATAVATAMASFTTNGEQSSGGGGVEAPNPFTNILETIELLASAVPNAASQLSDLKGKIDAIKSKDIYVNVTTNKPTVNATATLTLTLKTVVTDPKGASVTVSGGNVTHIFSSKAKGNVALAKGSAFAQGRKNVLVGELGPELVVSGGRYYTVGDNGPEFVDLAEDAIVFNHKQTKRLLKGKHANGRGEPIYSENKSISFATGNVTGPAMASAKAALASLKQIRAMWQSLLNASAKDLGALAGRKGGGGGGGGGGGDKEGQPTAATMEIQRWYNLLRQIDRLEKDITYQEQLQNKIESDRVANGYALYDSYKLQLGYLDDQISRQKELMRLQQSWLDNRVKDIQDPDKSVLAKIFTYDAEKRILQYRGDDSPGSGFGLDILEHLNRRDINNQAIGDAATAFDQLRYLYHQKVDLTKLIFNDDGTKVAAKVEIDTGNNDLILYNPENENEKLKGDELNNAYTQMVENFFDLVQSEMDEIDSLQDSIDETEKSILEEETKQNEILQKLIDNELAVEKEIAEAIEAREQKNIDDLQDMRDALEDANSKFLDGLSNQLDKERQMYDNNKNDQELTKLQRQLTILQRSGGSASQIRQLQEQISSKQQDSYFEAQQQQIDAIQEASDKQIERLDTQIDLMTETLEYQKENGLFWQEVRQIMMRTPEEVMDLLQRWKPEYRSDSELQISENLREFELKFETWAGQRDEGIIDSLFQDFLTDISTSGNFDSVINDENVKQQAKEAYATSYRETQNAKNGEKEALNIYKKARNEQAVKNTAEASFEKWKNTAINTQNKKDIFDKFSSNFETTYLDKFKEKAVLDDNDNLINEEEATNYAIAEARDKTISGIDNYISYIPDSSGHDRYWESINKTSGNGINQRTLPRNTKIHFVDYSEIKGYNLLKFISEDEKYNGWVWYDEFVGHEDFASYKERINKLKLLRSFSSGGLIDFTGPAMVHGSKSRPEAVLNAEQTKILKNGLLENTYSMSNSVLDSLNRIRANWSYELEHLYDDYKSNSSLGDTIIINEANVNLNATLTNDYDANRAADIIMDEIVRIARKSGTRSLSRR